MTPDSLAALSDSLFSISVALYSLAVVAFCAQLAFGRRPARAPGTRRRRRRPAPTPARAPPPRTPAGAAGASIAMALTVARRADPRRRPGRPRAGHRPAALGQHVRVRDGDRARRGRRLRRASPCARPALRHIGLFVLAPVVLALVLIGLFLYAEAGPLVAALRSYWLAIHVTTAIIGFGDLLRQRASPASCTWSGRDTRPGWPPGEARRTALRRPGCPAAAALDRVAHRTAVFGFPIWTFAVIAGAIWAEARLGPLLGLGPQGDLGLHRLGGLRRLPARPDDGRLARAARRLGQRRRPGRDDLQPALRQHGVDRAAQLRRRQTESPLTLRDRRARGAARSRR